MADNTASNMDAQRESIREADEKAQREGGSRQYQGAGLESVPPRPEGYRRAAIRESRIKDRPYATVGDTVNIKIELDLEVEVDLYARVKGDVTIGLL